LSRETAGWWSIRRDGGEVHERVPRFLTETADPGELKTLRPAKERAKGEEGSHEIPRLCGYKTPKYARTMRADG
jgi:hypothetical protein